MNRARDRYHEHEHDGRSLTTFLVCMECSNARTTRTTGARSIVLIPITDIGLHDWWHDHPEDRLT